MITLHIPLIGYAEREPPKFNRQEWGLWIAYERRRSLASISLYACTLAALLICIVIATLFVEVLFGLHIRGLVSALFICAMAALIGGLSTFLREVYLATRTMKISLWMHGID